MSKLLVIKAHPHTSKSLSLMVGKKFIIRDLYAGEGVPPLNDVTMEAWRKQNLMSQ